MIQLKLSYFFFFLQHPRVKLLERRLSTAFTGKDLGHLYSETSSKKKKKRFKSRGGPQGQEYQLSSFSSSVVGSLYSTVQV